MARVTETKYSGSVSQGYAVRMNRSFSQEVRDAIRPELESLTRVLEQDLYVYCEFWSGGSVRTREGYVVEFSAEECPALSKALESWDPNWEED